MEFKKAKSRSRPIRKRRHSSESDSESEDENFRSKLDDIKELQKLRDRPHGVSAEGLYHGKKIDETEEVEDDDPFKRNTGGFVDMKALKKKPLKKEDAEAIGTAFAAETNRRDEDTEMLKYVEEELARRKGKGKSSDKNQTSLDPSSQKPEDALYVVPENLNVQGRNKRSEDMLSNQMLSGIPEIDLGIHAKIRNIEATEDAKQELIIEKMKKKAREVSFVPTNMAVNFVQHNRFNIEDTAPILKKEEAPKPKPVRVGDMEKLKAGRDGPGGVQVDEKATDDFHYEKFKKQMRRY
ncbi:hypothetical protein ScPMuIL_010204 [Solemya velum]